MAVVNRVQRAYSFTGRTPASFQATDSASEAALQSSGAARCAAGLAAADTAAFIATGLAVSILPIVAPDQVPDDVLLWFAGAYAALIGFFACRAHYEHRGETWSVIRDIGFASAGVMFIAGWAAMMLDRPLPRLALIVAAALFPALVVPFRAVARRILDRAGLWRIPVVVVGSGEWAETAVSALLGAPRLGLDVVAQTGPAAVLAGMSHEPWKRLLQQHGARQVILAFDPSDRQPPELTAALVRERVPYAVMPHLEGLPVAGCRQTRFFDQGAVLLSYKNNLDKPVARAVKTAFDVVVAGLALLVLAPVMLILAGLVSLDGGPILFGHTRIGAGGKLFKCFKFRSMVVDSDAALKAYLAESPEAAEEWASTHKLRNDPRVTAIGRLLRKTSLDELPQLLNVVRLEMSLVGPRPIVAPEVVRYAEDIAFYYETRPGITGLWQVSGRSDTTYAQRVRLDAWYVKNWSLWQDIAILLKTIPAVLTARGAG